MLKVKEIIIVEGAYDKIRLSSFIDGIIYVTGGFSIMSDEKRLEGLRNMVEKHGGIIFTDSDGAGFRIRNFLKQHLPHDKIKHAYIPDVLGKERRKRKPGAEGLMGVEGMTEQVITDAIIKAGCTQTESVNQISQITKTDLFMLGLTGRENSSTIRKKVTGQLGIPEKISTNMLCDYLSRTVTLDELKNIIEKTSSEN